MADDVEDDDINVSKVRKRCAILLKTISLSNGKNNLILLIVDLKTFPRILLGKLY
jgi:hypothetical protein